MMAHARRYFLYGLTIFAPIFLTVYTLYLTFKFVDGFLAKFIEPVFIKFFGVYFWGISIVVFLLIISLIGFLASHFLGRMAYSVFDRLLLNLPIINQVYPAMKELIALVFSQEKPAFKQVVFVEYPRKGVYAMGFLMNDGSKSINEKLRGQMCSVLIPSSPSPFSGFVTLVPKEDVIFTDISVDKALKFLVSDGVVNPD